MVNADVDFPKPFFKENVGSKNNDYILKVMVYKILKLISREIEEKVQQNSSVRQYYIIKENKKILLYLQKYKYNEEFLKSN